MVYGMNKSAKVGVGVSLDPRQLDRLDIIAVATARSRSWHIGHAIEAYLDRLDAEKATTDGA